MTPQRAIWFVGAPVQRLNTHTHAVTLPRMRARSGSPCAIDVNTLVIRVPAAAAGRASMFVVVPTPLCVRQFTSAAAEDAGYVSEGHAQLDSVIVSAVDRGLGPASIDRRTSDHYG